MPKLQYLHILFKNGWQKETRQVKKTQKLRLNGRKLTSKQIRLRINQIKTS